MACPTLIGHGPGCGKCGWVWMVYPSASIASSVSTQVVVPQTVHLSVAASAFYCVSCLDFKFAILQLQNLPQIPIQQSTFCGSSAFSCVFSLKGPTMIGFTYRNSLVFLQTLAFLKTGVREARHHRPPVASPAQ